MEALTVPRTWIFQANPDRFDIEGFLAESTGDLLWLVTTNRENIAVGDTVYLWQSGKNAGVVAESVVAEAPRLRTEDPFALGFWKDPADANATAVRATLKLVRVSRSILKRSWLLEDHVLSSLNILRQAAGTNFSVSEEHAKRLSALWANTGTDWTYPEVVAALWAYSRVWNQPISKTAGSPVDEVSRLINRVITGVYNKLMNLRALDPRVEGKGFDRGSKTDKIVWDKFFDAASGTIREGELNAEFQRLWSSPPAAGSSAPSESAMREALEEEEDRLGKRTLEQLREAYVGQTSGKQPRRRQTTTSAFERSAVVSLIAKKRANYRCEVPACAVPTFLDEKKRPYVETHHLEHLAQGGADTPENTVCVCALHHRELHIGQHRASLTQVLQEWRTKNP